MKFDDFIDSCNKEYAYIGGGMHEGPPCPTCGCAWVLLDPVVYCVDCSTRSEQAGVLVERLIGVLDDLAELVPLLPPATKAVVHGDCEFALLAVSKLVLGTGGHK